ncbi:MAG: hypothetical protein GX589_11310 [Deltaproteobacteria bacterium]|nr:hypothetical protein [Deltaproteobacteria bacterium]
MTYGDSLLVGDRGAGNCKVLFLAEELVGDQRGYASGPERGLLAVLLFDGVQSYLNYAAAKSNAARTRYREAFDWVNSADDEYVFSFNSVCEALGINPGYLRLGIINTANSQGACRRKRRRNF